MFRNILFAIALVILGVSFYYSRDFQLIAAGVAVLLFGMSFLERGFESAATGTLYKLVKRLSNNFMLSFLLGFLSTTVLQSSSLITVIAISFLSTGLLSMRSGLGIVFGANLGTTSTAWIVALLGVKLNISALALPMIFFGILLQNRKVALQKAFGNILLGLGGFFMGIYLMQLGFSDLESAVFFSPQTHNAFMVATLSLISGLVLTAILQSSSATMAIIITALAAGQIDFNQSLAMAIGANIGTTVTAVLSSANARIAGKQLAMGHLIFNLSTGIIALSILPLFTKVVAKSADLLELDSTDLSQHLALFHTLFNLLGVLLFLPLAKPLERLLLRLKPRKSAEVKPKYLISDLEKVPQSAYLALHKETHHVLHILAERMNAALNERIANSKKGFLAMLMTAEHKPFKQLYYTDIKPILAEIQGTAARLSGTYKTQQFSVVSRLVAEISRDFDHILKASAEQEQMEQKAFYNLYFDLLNQLRLTSQELEKVLVKNDGQQAELEMDKRSVDFDVFNEALEGRINLLINTNELTALAGTTAIHTADYTKRIVHKLNRAIHLLYTVNYLEMEAKMAFNEG